MATFYNQASLTYNGQVTNSNITTGNLLEVLSATKRVLNDGYCRESRLTYAIGVTNTGTEAQAVTITDDLGGYIPTGATETVYPLTYIDGSATLYINGVDSGPIAVTVAPPLSFQSFNIPAGGNALILYQAEVNGFAPLAVGSTITNTATVTGGGLPDPITVSAVISAEGCVSLSIAKAICPETVTGNSPITYTFILQNTGNTASLADGDLIVSDIFDPILSNITVSLNGTALAGTDYTYDPATGAFATVAGVVTVPAATYATDPTTGAIIVSPGVAVLTVNGTI